MKRLIECPCCHKRRRKEYNRLKTVTDKSGNILLADTHPDEKEISKSGYTIGNYRCDSCNVKIPNNGRCFAVSILGIGQTYTPWEDDYITRECRDKGDER